MVMVAESTHFDRLTNLVRYRRQGRIQDSSIWRGGGGGGGVLMSINEMDYCQYRFLITRNYIMVETAY